MKKISEYMVNESSSKIYVLYGAPKKGERADLFDRVTIGVYSSRKAMKEDELKAEEAFKSTEGYEDYEVLYYEAEVNQALIDI